MSYRNIVSEENKKISEQVWLHVWIQISCLQNLGRIQ